MPIRSNGVLEASDSAMKKNAQNPAQSNANARAMYSTVFIPILRLAVYTLGAVSKSVRSRPERCARTPRAAPNSGSHAECWPAAGALGTLPSLFTRGPSARRDRRPPPAAGRATARGARQLARAADRHGWCVFGSYVQHRAATPCVYPAHDRRPPCAERPSPASPI